VCVGGGGVPVDARGPVEDPSCDAPRAKPCGGAALGGPAFVRAGRDLAAGFSGGFRAAGRLGPVPQRESGAGVRLAGVKREAAPGEGGLRRQGGGGVLASLYVIAEGFSEQVPKATTHLPGGENWAKNFKKNGQELRLGGPELV